MNFTTFFSQKYLLNTSANSANNSYVPLLIIFGLMILLAIGISLQKKNIKKIIGRFFVPLLSTGILGLIYLFARHESLPYLSYKLFLVLIICMFVVWILILLVWMIKFVPKHLSTNKTEERYKKYLPKAKNK